MCGCGCVPNLMELLRRIGHGQGNPTYTYRECSSIRVFFWDRVGLSCCCVSCCGGYGFHVMCEACDVR